MYLQVGGGWESFGKCSASGGANDLSEEEISLGGVRGEGGV